MKTIGYVSNEDYLALNDVNVVFEKDHEILGDTKSLATGAVRTDLPPGSYTLTFAKAGYGSKHVEVTLPVKEPIKFRLLSDKLVGYMAPRWSTSGEKSCIRINSTTSCRVELFRYGKVKESYGVITWLDEHGPRAMTQVIPDGDIAASGLQFGTIGFPYPGMTWKIEAPEKSGLYYVHLENEGGEFFSMPWIVSPKKPTAKIAVLAATNNWSAYNNYGGRGNYINAEGLPPRPTVNARQDLSRYSAKDMNVFWKSPNDVYPPISFERPEYGNVVGKNEELTSPMSGRIASSCAPGMWRLLGWLEREGYEYDLYSDNQLRDGTLDLDAYETLLTEIHPEYWYREEYTRVRDWVFERGGKFMYLGGNGLDCEVEYVDETTVRFLTDKSNTSHEGGVFDPALRIPKEGRFDNRFHKSTNESPAQLIGLVCDGEGTGAPYECRNEGHWVFAGTGLKNGDKFGINSLHERIPGGASGHEMDNRTANTGEGFISLAKGLNPETIGSSGAEMLYKDFPGKGGEVFAVGSMNYISSLLVDKPLSDITKNVLNHFLKNGKGKK